MKGLILGIILFLQSTSAFALNEQFATGYRPNPFRYIGAKYRHFSSSKTAFIAGAASTLPEEYDLRDKAPLIIRDQGSCGSCWFHGTKGVLEYLTRLRDKRDIEISAQWGIDCQPARFMGCNGGDFAFEKLKAPYGAIYESEYPNKYNARDGRCDASFIADKSHFHEQVIDFGFVGKQGSVASVEEIQHAMFDTESPVGMTVGAGGLNPDSKGWVTQCRSASTNHIIYVVGWLEGSKHGYPAGPYWIMVNSWGERWGDKGVAYVRARSNGTTGTVCSDLGKEEVVWATYKPACTPQPQVDAGKDRVIVLAPSMTHSAVIGTKAAADHTYQWSPLDGVQSPNAAVTKVSPKKTTKYTLTATTKCGSASADVLVRVFRERTDSLTGETIRMEIK